MRLVECVVSLPRRKNFDPEHFPSLLLMRDLSSFSLQPATLHACECICMRDSRHMNFYFQNIFYFVHESII